MELRNKTTSEFRTVFRSPLGVPNSQVPLYLQIKSIFHIKTVRKQLVGCNLRSTISKYTHHLVIFHSDVQKLPFPDLSFWVQFPTLWAQRHRYINVEELHIMLLCVHVLMLDTPDLPTPRQVAIGNSNVALNIKACLTVSFWHIYNIYTNSYQAVFRNQNFCYIYRYINPKLLFFFEISQHLMNYL